MAEHICNREKELGSIETKIDMLIAIAKENHEVLKGNGKPGLCTEVELIKQKQGWIWAAITSVGTMVLGVIGWLVKVVIEGI